ncbi:MAG: VOC family protein, partial [Acidobacteriota bacterium]
MSTPRPTPGTFCWFECGTTDAADARAFYTELFGWEAAEVPMPVEGGGTYTLFRVEGKDVAGLFPLSGPQFEGVPSHWSTYVAVEDADESVRRAASLGGRALVPPLDVPGIARIAVVQDPTGASISLFQAGGHAGAAPLGPAPGTFGWSELATRDTVAAGAFYSGLFGWKRKADAGGLPYTEFQVEGRSIGGMMPLTEHHGDAPPHWLPYVMVADCDVTAGRAGDLG